MLHVAEAFGWRHGVVLDALEVWLLVILEVQVPVINVSVLLGSSGDADNVRLTANWHACASCQFLVDLIDTFRNIGESLIK